MQTMTGTLTFVQESRFQLVDDDGISHHFILSHSAAAEPSQLQNLQRHQARIRIGFSDAKNVVAKVAYRIELCGESEDA